MQGSHKKPSRHNYQSINLQRRGNIQVRYTVTIIRDSKKSSVLSLPHFPTNIHKNPPGKYVRIGCPRNEKNKIFGSNLFRETKQKMFSVCFGVSNLYRNNRNKQKCFETIRNNPEFSEKYLNMLSFTIYHHNSIKSKDIIRFCWSLYCYFYCITVQYST